MAPAIRGGWGRAGRGFKACVAVGALLAVLAGAVVSSPVAGQEAADGDVEVRIVARKLESGRIEFGLQQRSSDDTWGDRQLPRVRFFPTTAGVGRWLASSALDLPAGEVRIVARKLESGRIEFGLQQRSSDDTWGDRQLPRVRFFPTTAGVGRWLASSPLILRTSRPADRDAAVTDDDQTTSRPADRDAAVTDDDQTTSRPADRDAAVTDDDRYAQFEGDIIEVASPHNWWKRPRGDLLVHVHLCVEQGNEHLAKRELIDAHVRALNEFEAPFYTWQSSGLLNVSFTAGTITIANDVASTWGRGYLPASCTRSLSAEAHIAHAVILAGNPEETDHDGWGNLGGPIGATYIAGAAAQTVASIKRQPDRLIFVTRHEFDHNIGVSHVATVGPEGYTRFDFSLSPGEWETLRDGDVRSWQGGQLVGTLSGFPAAIQQDGVLEVFPCGFLEQQGWPVGPNKPACFRSPPISAEDLRVDWRADGRPRVTWQPPPNIQSTEPVTGYTILVSTVTFDSRGNPSDYSVAHEYGRYGRWRDTGDSVIFDLDLPADARSFVLPRSPIGEYEYQVGDTFAVTVIPQSAVGLGYLEFVYASVGFPQSVISTEEVDTYDSEPRAFDLSWPSSDLVDLWAVVKGQNWSRSDPDGPIYYIPRNIEYHTSHRNSDRIEEGFDVSRGQSYNVTVLGCLKDYSRPYSSDLVAERCFPYATGTFTLETWGISETSVHDVSQLQLTISLGEDAGEHEFMCQPDAPCRSVFVTLTSFPSGPENPGPHEFVCYVSDGSPNSAIVAGTATYENLGDSPWTVEVCAVNLVPGGSVYVELDSVRSNTITL